MLELTIIQLPLGIFKPLIVVALFVIRLIVDAGGYNRNTSFKAHEVYSSSFKSSNKTSERKPITFSISSFILI
jgi:hypothetical protein